MARDLTLTLKMLAVNSANTEDRDIASISYTDTPENVEIRNLTVLSATSMSITLDSFPVLATIDYLIVQNYDSTNYVTVTFATAAGSRAHRIAAGKFGVFPDVAVGTTPTIQANTSPCLCRIILIGDDSV